ncbi:hypothetical protein KY328_05095 [Candidatus Woesearchaeota archaeon]|nr:hypothetical protein [Candidatus Woesearchaeota archaeon]MBW3022275.1 hypothetical protein [Candidatus Woesearchaeota archaeon]
MVFDYAIDIRPKLVAAGFIASLVAMVAVGPKQDVRHALFERTIAHADTNKDGRLQQIEKLKLLDDLGVEKPKLRLPIRLGIATGPYSMLNLVGGLPVFYEYSLVMGWEDMASYAPGGRKLLNGYFANQEKQRRQKSWFL